MTDDIDKQLMIQLDKVRILEDMIIRSESEVKHLRTMLADIDRCKPDDSIDIEFKVGCFQYSPLISTEHSSPCRKNSKVKGSAFNYTCVGGDHQPALSQSNLAEKMEKKQFEFRLALSEKNRRDLSDNLAFLTEENRAKTKFAETMKVYLDIAIQQKEEAVNKNQELIAESAKLENLLKQLSMCPSWNELKLQHESLQKQTDQTDDTLGKREPIPEVKDQPTSHPVKIKVQSHFPSKTQKKQTARNSPPSRSPAAKETASLSLSLRGEAVEGQITQPASRQKQADNEAEACLDKIFGLPANRYCR